MSSINYYNYCDYISMINWEQLLQGCLDIEVGNDQLDYIADCYNSQLRGAFDNTGTDVDYITTTELTPTIYDDARDCKYSIRNVQIVVLRSGNIALGLDVLSKPASVSNRYYRCCFRGWWDGNSWHINHTE